MGPWGLMAGQLGLPWQASDSCKGPCFPTKQLCLRNGTEVATLTSTCTHPCTHVVTNMTNYTDLTHRKEYFRINHSLPLPHLFRSWLSLPYAQIFSFMKDLQFAEDGEGSAMLQYQTEDITPASILILFLQAQRLGCVSIFMGSLISKDLHVLQTGPNLFLTSTEKLKEGGTRFLLSCPSQHSAW